MTKHQLENELATSARLPLSSAVKAIDGIIRIAKETLARGEELNLRGFGTLTVVDVKERPAIHFKTKEPIIVPAHRTVKFRPGRELKESLNK